MNCLKKNCALNVYPECVWEKYLQLMISTLVYLFNISGCDIQLMLEEVPQYNKLYAVEGLARR